MSQKINQVMGEPIGKLVSSFNFKQINEQDSSANDHLNVGLAPAYTPSTTPETIDQMDRLVRVAIGGVAKTLPRVPRQEWNFDTIMGACMQNPLLEPDTNVGTTRSDRLTVQSSSELRSGDAVNKTQKWFTELIGDHDVINSTQINADVLAAIVDKAAGAVTAFESNKDDRHDKTLLDICVLRFPDLDRPFFQLYRIRLGAWANSHLFSFSGHNDNACGIQGEYNSRKFNPRESVISSLRDMVVENASEEAKSLFAPA